MEIKEIAAVRGQVEIGKLWLELTTKCNLKCIHCYSGSDSSLPLHGRMQIKHWKSLIDQAARMNTKVIQLIGGEPLLVPYADELIEYLFERKMDAEVFTNANAITEERARLFSDLNVVAHVSLYAPDMEAHDRVTKMPGSFTRTLAGVELLIDHGVLVHGAFIETDENADLFGSTVDFWRKKGVGSVSWDRQRKIGRSSSKADKSSELSELCGNCGHGRICVTANGDVYPCIMARSHVVGNVFDAKLNSIVQSARLARFRERLNDPLRSRARGENALGCLPDGDCGPLGPCRPDLPCIPDGACRPDTICGPDKECSPTLTRNSTATSH